MKFRMNVSLIVFSNITQDGLPTVCMYLAKVY